MKRKKKENCGMANLTCSYSWILVHECEGKKKRIPLRVNLWTKLANRYGAMKSAGGGRGSGGGCVGAGNRVRSHRRRQHGGYYTSVTPPSKLQKFYKTQRSSRDYVPRDLWPGLCYCASRLESRLYCTVRNKVLRFLTRTTRDTGSRLFSWLRNCGLIRNNENLILGSFS